MLKKYGAYFILLSSLVTFPALSQTKQIAITVDDLPFVGTTNNKPSNLQREHDRFMKIVQALTEYNAPATGFVFAGSIEQGQWELLETFHKAGFVIANHTFSHLSLNKTDTQKYIDDIGRASALLAPLFTGQKFFRYPYLAEGKGESKQQVHDYLAANQYLIAPVTIDSKDYRFNAELFAIPYRQREKNLSRLKQRYLSYIWQQTLRAEKLANGKPVKQILLIHANLLNSHFLGDVLKMYKDNGYEFISLSDALTNPAPKIESLDAASAPSLTTQETIPS